MERDKVSKIVQESIVTPKLSELHPLRQSEYWKDQLKALLNLIPGVGGAAAQEIQALEDYQTQELFRNFVAFVMELIDTTPEEREKFAEDVAKKADDTSGNVIVGMVNQLDNINKQKFFANLTKARINGDISIEQFFRLHSILVRIPYVDLASLPNYQQPYYDESGDTELLYSTGALKLSVIAAGEDDKYVLSVLGEDLLRYGIQTTEIDVKREKGTSIDASGDVLDRKAIENVDRIVEEKTKNAVDAAMEWQHL